MERSTARPTRARAVRRRAGKMVGKKVKRLLSARWFKIVLSLVLVGILALKADVRELGGAVMEARASWLALALIGYVASQVLSTLRWCMLARPLGFREPVSHFLIGYFSGMYLNLFAPSTVAGDIGRALFLARGKSTRALAVTSVIADRGLGFVVLVWIAAIAVLLSGHNYPIPRPLYWAAWLAFPAMIAGWWWGPLLMVRFLPAGNKWRVLVERDLAPYRNDHRVLIPSSLLAAVFHILQVSTQIFIAWALNLNVPWGFFFVFVPVVNIAGMVPVSFSGVGVREFLYRFFLLPAGVDDHTAVAMGLLSSAIVLCTGLSGAPVFLWFHDREIDSAIAEAESAAGSDEADTVPVSDRT
jgi:hypothetical protein